MTLLLLLPEDYVVLLEVSAAPAPLHWTIPASLAHYTPEAPSGQYTVPAAIGHYTARADNANP